MTRDEVVFRAGLSRFVLGAGAMTLLPLLYPRTRGLLWVYVLYLGVAAVEQVLIRKQVGGQARTLLAGLVDVAFISFLCHRLGSVGTIVSSFYFFAGVLNAMVVGLRVGVVLAICNAVAYAAVVWMEHFQWLPFAPDAPDVARLGAPSFQQAVTASAMVTVFMTAST